MYPSKTPALREVSSSVIIVKHEEDTTQLAGAMNAEGFEVIEQKGIYSAEEERYSKAIKCLINHSQAWEKASVNDGYTIIIEADFVPVLGFGGLPLPFKPEADSIAMAWLYSVGPVIYGADPVSKAIWGHNAGTVAYILNAEPARRLLELFQKDMDRDTPGEYRNWEVRYPVDLRRIKDVRCYIPFKMYGEHGGKTNPEHSTYGYVGWHEADNLAGKLHYLPMYAEGKRRKYLIRRLRGRLRGIYRFIRGKYFDGWCFGFLRSKGHRFLKFRIAFSRLI